MDIRYEWRGMDLALSKTVGGKLLGDVLRERSKGILEDAYGVVQQHTPVRTGRLLASEEMRVDETPDGGAAGRIWTDLHYAPTVEKRRLFFARGAKTLDEGVKDMWRDVGDAIAAEWRR